MSGDVSPYKEAKQLSVTGNLKQDTFITNLAQSKQSKKALHMLTRSLKALPKSHSQSQLAFMTQPNPRNTSPSRALTAMEGLP